MRPFYLSVTLLVVKRVHIYEKQAPVEGDMPLMEVLLIVVAYRYETLYAAFGHFVFVPAQGGNTEIGHICRPSRFRLHRWRKWMIRSICA